MSGGQEGVLWALLIVASATDLIWGKIFNKFVWPTLALGLVFQGVSGGVHSALLALASVVCAFLIFFPLYWLGAMAAGDVKLLMVIGAWSNVRVVLATASCAVVIGAAVGLWVLLRKEGVKASVASVRGHLRVTDTAVRSHRMPFAPAFLCAFLFLKIASFYKWYAY